MANTLTPTDVYSIVNAMAAEMYGSNNTLTAFNTSTFATVGEAMLRTGYENTVGALSAVIGKTIVAARPYRGKFRIIMKVPQEFGLITLSPTTGSRAVLARWNLPRRWSPHATSRTASRSCRPRTSRSPTAWRRS